MNLPKQNYSHNALRLLPQQIFSFLKFDFYTNLTLNHYPKGRGSIPVLNCNALRNNAAFSSHLCKYSKSNLTH